MNPQPTEVETIPRQITYGWLPWVAVFAIVAATAGLLRWEGRIWWCACGQASLWSGDARGSHNSQHLFDPYSFTHFLHGLIFFGVLGWLLPRRQLSWRFAWSVVLECGWELLENTQFVTERFRAGTAAQGYVGDSVANSLGDIISCMLGFAVASRLGLRNSAILFVLIEIALIIAIRDSLLLSTLMLVFPIDSLRQWQSGG